MNKDIKYTLLESSHDIIICLTDEEYIKNFILFDIRLPYPSEYIKYCICKPYVNISVKAFKIIESYRYFSNTFVNGNPDKELTETFLNKEFTKEQFIEILNKYK